MDSETSGGRASELPQQTLDKMLRLFTYLRELAKLRGKVVREYRQYDGVVWFSSIPTDRGCFTAFCDQEKAEKTGVWLEVARPPIKAPPPVPDLLRRYVEGVDLWDAGVLPEIPGEDLTPEYLAAWEEYCENDWLPWAAKYEALMPAHRVYVSLYAIYQQLKREAEQQELVVGFGLLSWRTPSDQVVQRHLITVRAEISLDPRTGTLCVSPAAGGISPTLEYDMLELDERPTEDALAAIKMGVSTIGSDIGNVASIEAPLKTWAYEVSNAATYQEDMSAPERVGATPLITLSPAVILRRRARRIVEQRMDEVLSELERNKDKKPTGGMTQLVGDGALPSDRVPQPPAADGRDKHSQEVLFPLPANEQQLRIVERLRDHNGVLVQGPPGTGKSHTIVNLTAHLLAEGKRVLITSQTPRALHVIKQMMADKEAARGISALCVSLLGSDRSHLRDLEQSVRQIIAKMNSWDPDESRESVADLTATLDSLRRQEARFINDLRAVREKEIYSHDVCGGAYRGTAQQIAQQLAEERDRYESMVFEVENDEPPMSDEEAAELLSLWRWLSDGDGREATLEGIDTKRLLPPNDLANRCEREQQAREEMATFTDTTELPGGDAVRQMPATARGELEDTCRAFLRQREAALEADYGWAECAVRDACSGRHHEWWQLYQNLKPPLTGSLADDARAAEEASVHAPGDIDWVVAKADAEDLLSHLEGGGGMGFWGFRPSPVKRTKYLLKQVRVNGRSPNNVELLGILINRIDVDNCIERLWGYWQPYAESAGQNRPAQVASLMALTGALRASLKLCKHIARVREILRSAAHVPEPDWNDVESVRGLLLVLDTARAASELDAASGELREQEKTLRDAMSRPNSHPAISDALAAVTDRDVDAYTRAYSSLHSYEEKVKRLGRLRQLHKSLVAGTPEMAKALAVDPAGSRWDTILRDLSGSWTWARANAWLSQYIEGTTEGDLSSKLRETREAIGNTLGKLAAEQAWGHCIKRMMKSSARQHLVAWQHAVKKIGKGTGKFAEKHRRDAQEHMAHCKEAIPAWIMPLYRVFESVTPAAGAFDVAIIDEASQSSVDAVYLLYIAKKIVVVGDDKQISPDAPGVPLAPIHELQKRHLSMFPVPEAFGPDRSFFDLAEIVFSGRITLREHF
ncbi:AAA family ATPase, partial [bacterium]|nr:AAA family ATPase [bacterium]